jgi:hypothetical protein
MLPGTVQGTTSDATPGTWDSAPAPVGIGQVNGVPDLVTAQYTRINGGTTVANGGPCGLAGKLNCVVVDYSFSEGVSVNQAATTSFFAYLSDGSWVNPVALSEPSGTAGPPGTYTGSNIVRAYYSPATSPLASPDAAQFDEYLVKAGVSGGVSSTQLSVPSSGVTGCNAVQQAFGCAVVSTATGYSNTPGSAPIGGNAGGSGVGYTDSGDPLRVTFDTLTNTATVLFDQRVYNATAGSDAALAGNYFLLDGNGSRIAGGTSISTCSPNTTTPVAYPCPLPNSPVVGGPGATTVWIGYNGPTVEVGNAKGFEIAGRILGVAPTGFAEFGGDAFNVGAGPPQSGYGSGTPNATPPGGPLGAGANLQQEMSPNAVSAFAHLRAGKHWSHKRMTAAYLRHVLARTKHHNRHHR